MAWAAMTHHGFLVELLMAEWQSKLRRQRLAGMTTRWWHARTLAALAITLEQEGATDEAREPPRLAARPGN